MMADGELQGFNVTIMGATHGNKDTYPRLSSLIGFYTPERAKHVAGKVMLVQRDHGNRAEWVFLFFNYAFIILTIVFVCNCRVNHILVFLSIADTALETTRSSLTLSSGNPCDRMDELLLHSTLYTELTPIQELYNVQMGWSFPFIFFVAKSTYVYTEVPIWTSSQVICAIIEPARDVDSAEHTMDDTSTHWMVRAHTGRYELNRISIPWITVHW